jgi:hypothetical protein
MTAWEIVGRRFSPPSFYYWRPKWPPYNPLSATRAHCTHALRFALPLGITLSILPCLRAENLTRLTTYRFSANGAVSFQPGATPQGSCYIETPSAESAIHSLALNRAFSALDGLGQRPGAMPQAVNEVAPLALNTYSATALTVAKASVEFEPNQGQTNSAVGFIARSGRGTSYFTPKDVLLTRRSAPPTSRTMRISFVRSNPDARLSGSDETGGKVNYFIGNNPEAWHKDLPSYRAITYKDLYCDVDLTFRGNDGGLKGTYTVSPGADPAQIGWRYRGAESLKIDQHGNLKIKLGGHDEIIEEAPVAWQESANGRVPIESRYFIAKDGTVRFSLGPYDKSKPLIIDPTLTYSTFFGGSNDDPAYKIALDCERNIYIAGYTNSLDFPTKDPIQTDKAAGYDAFVTKLSPDGSTVIYSTYLGGGGGANDNDLLQSMTVDPDGNVYLTGNTYATDYPTANAYQTNNAGGSDIFLTKIDPTGSTLIYSTYLGGSNFDFAFDVAVDASGSTYLTGYVISSDFPTTAGAYQPGFGGGAGDAYVTKFSPDGKSLIYSTYIGGSDYDQAYGIAVDGDGNAYIAGVTASLNFPLANAYQGIIGGNRDVFVTKLNPAGSQLVFSTYLGGALDDQCSAMTIDRAGNVYLTGRTQSANFPTAPLGSVFQPAIGSATDAFVSKVSADGMTLVYSTFLGGIMTDYGYGVAVNEVGEAYAVGETASLNFPQSNSLQAYGGGNDAFVTKFNAAGTNVVYSTYLGGSGDEGALSVVRDGLGSVFVTGFTRSPNYPTVNAIQPAYAGGSSDAFISKIFETAPPPVALTGAVSRKTHGNAGTFDVDLPLTGNPGIECRSGGANGDYTLVFTFANPLTSVCGASVRNGTGSIRDNGIDSNDAHQYVVNLTGVTNAQVITVSLSNVADSLGNFSSTVSASMGVLLGDVNSTGRTDAGDVTTVRNHTVSIPDQETFRYDVNASGRIDAGDVTVTRNASVTVLP